MHAGSSILDATGMGSGIGPDEGRRLLRPIEAAPKRTNAIHPIFEFEGVRYYRGGSYYHNVASSKRLHVAVWERNFGAVPDGHDIHHKDHDRSNNNPENLECLPESDHGRLHMRDPDRIAWARIAIKTAIAAAASKRRANPEWSSNISKATGAAMAHKLATEPKQAFTCVRCGCDYKAHAFLRKRGFCSPACQSAARRASGVDDELRTCVECGTTFTTNRYSKTVACSPHCAGKISARARLQHHR